MKLPISIRRFRRAFLSLCAAVLILLLACEGIFQRQQTAPPPSMYLAEATSYLSAEEASLLRSYKRSAVEAHRPIENQAGLAGILSETRNAVGFDRLEFQFHPDHYLWLLADTPDSIRVHGVDVQMMLYHTQEFLDWLESLKSLAPATPLNCRLWRAEAGEAQEAKAGSSLRKASRIANDGGGHSPPNRDSRKESWPIAQIHASCELLWHQDDMAAGARENDSEAGVY